MAEEQRGFLAECREWWRLHSVKLAAAAGAIGAFLTGNPDVIMAIVGFLPVDPVTRAIYAAIAGLAIFLVPTAVRLWPQDLIDKEGE